MKEYRWALHSGEEGMASMYGHCWCKLWEETARGYWRRRGLRDCAVRGRTLAGIGVGLRKMGDFWGVMYCRCWVGWWREWSGWLEVRVSLRSLATGDTQRSCFFAI